MNNKIGIFCWFGYVLPMGDRLRMIKEAGYDSVMLWWEDEYLPGHIDRNIFASLARDCGLAIENCHLPFEEANKLSAADKAVREHYLSLVMRQMEECKSSGVDKVVMHITRNPVAEADLTRMLSSMKKLIAFAEDMDMTIAAENTLDCEFIDRLLREYDSPALGLCYDTSHDFITGQSRGRILSDHIDRLMCVHISDNDFTDDRHWIPGQGLIPYGNIMDLIEKSGCCLSMEVYPAGLEKDMKPEDFLSKAFKALNSI